VGIVRQANPAARSILGYASPSGLHAQDLFRGIKQVRREGVEEDGPALAAAVSDAARSGTVYRRLEADYGTPGGERRVLGITLSPVRSASGEGLGAVCLVSDLTDITAMAQQVKLKENLASLGEMAAGIAHEFKNSLATISGYAQMLRRDLDGAAAQPFADKIEKETGMLARVVTDFLEFARPHSLMRDAVSVGELLVDCGRESGVELEMAGFEGMRVAGDSTLLRQAFSNLLRNSAEAAQGRAVRVRASAREEGGRVVLEIEDDAGGIKPDEMERIFIPFVTTKSQGTGLGLALVHRIVSEHGGSVRVENGDKGARFRVELVKA
jgi:signal transduction histidine kinase